MDLETEAVLEESLVTIAYGAFFYGSSKLCGAWAV